MAVNRFCARVDMTCFLNMASGGKSPDTRMRSWFFEIPSHCHDAAHWQELIPRIFYDMNVALRRREPNDAAWISVEDFKVKPIDVGAIVAGDGSEALPWDELDKQRIWEPAVCYFVNDMGQYDVMSANDFTELLLNRAWQTQMITEQKFIDFLDKHFSAREQGASKRIHASAAQRFQNLITVRNTPGVFRKQPGAGSFVCGPVAAADI